MTLIYLLLEVRIYNFKWRCSVKKKTLFFIFHRLPFFVWSGLLFILCYYLIMLGRLSKCIVMFCKYFSSLCCYTFVLRRYLIMLLSYQSSLLGWTLCAIKHNLRYNITAYFLPNVFYPTNHSSSFREMLRNSQD